jgi:hypothetical protein
MKVKRVVRAGINSIGEVFGETIYENCNLVMDDRHVDLSGPRYGSIATGMVTDIRTSYTGSTAHIHIYVIVRTNSGSGLATATTYRSEVWFVTFNNVE